MKKSSAFIVDRSALVVAFRGIVSTVSTSVSKTESPGSNPGTPAISNLHHGIDMTMMPVAVERFEVV